MKNLTVERVLEILVPRFRELGEEKERQLCRWPADAFAIAGYLLERSGAYRVAVQNGWWPADTARQLGSHLNEINRWAAEWRAAAVGSDPLPASLVKAWQRLLDHKSLPIADLTRVQPGDPAREDDLDPAALAIALLNLVAAADEASAGMGLSELPLVAPAGSVPAGARESFLNKAENRLLETMEGGEASTLCEAVDAAVVCVLPKFHTPQLGLTFRGLTHHLALCISDEVRPRWFPLVPSDQSRRKEAEFNLLLVPYPHDFAKGRFVPERDNVACGRSQFPDEYRFFRFEPPSAEEWLRDTYGKLLSKTADLLDSRTLHGVVFPELSFGSRPLVDSTKEEFEYAVERTRKLAREAFLLAGRTFAGTTPHAVQNGLSFTLPVPALPQGYTGFRQSKHHRWKLDRSQIESYGLEKPLETGREWWEHIEIPPREMHFIPLNPWLTCASLICEDLARQDPVARMVRTVGPTLVIALLLDGPQLASRWPGRYAGVLADDPGAGVLTVTSAGMVRQSNEVFSKRNGGTSKPPVIALWRGSGQTREISLADGAQAVLLSFRVSSRSEHSFDGRKRDKVSFLELKENKPGSPPEGEIPILV